MDSEPISGHRSPTGLAVARDGACCVLRTFSAPLQENVTVSAYNIAGIDVHKKMLAVVIASARDAELQFECRRFGARASELRHLSAWLQGTGGAGSHHGIDRPVLETGFGTHWKDNAAHNSRRPGPTGAALRERRRALVAELRRLGYQVELTALGLTIKARIARFLSMCRYSPPFPPFAMRPRKLVNTVTSRSDRRVDGPSMSRFANPAQRSLMQRAGPRREENGHCCSSRGHTGSPDGSPGGVCGPAERRRP